MQLKLFLMGSGLAVVRELVPVPPLRAVIDKTVAVDPTKAGKCGYLLTATVLKAAKGSLRYTDIREAKQNIKNM